MAKRMLELDAPDSGAESSSVAVVHVHDGLLEMSTISFMHVINNGI